MYISLSLSIAISKEFSLLVCNCPFSQQRSAMISPCPKHLAKHPY